MRTLAWIALQVAAFSAVIWSETMSSRQLGKDPDFVTAGIMGVVVALFVTALVAAARDLYMRYLSPRRHTGPTLNPRPAIGHDSEASGESERLAAPTRSGGDAPKVIPGRRIG